MLEYGETYLSENGRILEEIYAGMSPEAVELAKHMASEDMDCDEEADAEALVTSLAAPSRSLPSTGHWAPQS